MTGVELLRELEELSKLSKLSKLTGKDLSWLWLRVLLEVNFDHPEAVAAAVAAVRRQAGEDRLAARDAG